MTLLRQVVPGRDYMIIRRCSERRFFLRPDDDTNDAFIYCLRLAATRANVRIRAEVSGTTPWGRLQEVHQSH
jgi:hypothetical protein